MKPSEIMRQLNKFPNKLLGQHFLTDDKVLTDILEASKLEPEDTVVEIGPGLGVLTAALAGRVKRVIAIEADRELAENLRDKWSNVTVITGDALRIDWTVTLDDPSTRQGSLRVAPESYKIVANIPYSITSPLLRKIFLLAKKPTAVVLLIQKEVAERLAAQPGDSSRGFLTLLTEANATIKKIRTVKPGSFYPLPKVDSSVVVITPLAASRQEEIFWPAVEAGFRHKRQTLANSLKDLMIDKATSEKMLTELGLNPMIRPAELSLDDWMGLSKKVVEATKKR